MIVVMPVARGGGSLGLGPSGMSPGISAAGNVAPPAGRGAAGPGGAAAARRPHGPGTAPGLCARLPRGSDARRSRRPSACPTARRIARLAGLSAGGAATVNTAFSRPDLFRYVVIMSAGAGANVEQSYPKFFGENAAGPRP